jgi:hypothetical protein
MRFEKNEELRAMIDTLYDHAAELDRGDVLTHDVVRSILGVDRHQGHWQHCVNVVRKRLRDDRGIETWPTHNVGYRLLTVDETLRDFPRWRAARARRQERKARKGLAAIPTSSMTPHQQRVRLAQIDAIRASEKQMWHQARFHASIAKQAETKRRRIIAILPQETNHVTAHAV